MRKAGRKTFLRNDNDIQAIESVRCGYYFCCFSTNEIKGSVFQTFYCMKDQRKTPNVPGTDRVVTTKNIRKMLKIKCAVCRITKTRFLPGEGGKSDR